MLQTIRRYVRTFFGCKACSEHFEAVAKASMGAVKTPDRAVLWLWETHNLVNSRLAGEQKPPWGGQARVRRGRRSGGEAVYADVRQSEAVSTGGCPEDSRGRSHPRPPASLPLPTPPPRGACRAPRTVGGRGLGSNRCPESRWRRRGLSATPTAGRLCVSPPG